MRNVSQYFWTARERERIRLRRANGLPREEWTKDGPFKLWRFCNVRREDDKTTIWFRENVRQHVTGVDALKATIAFRWFNRIETGERIVDMLRAPATWNTETARQRLTGLSPVVTGAYIIKGYDGLSKLDGVLLCIHEAMPQLEEFYARWMAEDKCSLQEWWSDLTSLAYMGRFMAYEAVSDLRWCEPFNQADDINEWANAGPGCARGLSWVMYGKPGEFNPGSERDQIAMLNVMHDILEMSRDDKYWPGDWPKWEMREVEHWACEYDKYCRAASGEKQKRRFTL